jgi:cell division protease FtsH
MPNKMPDKMPDKSPNFIKNLFWWVIIILVISLFSGVLDNKNRAKNEIIFSDFLNRINNKEIVSAEIKGNEIYGKLSNGEDYFTYSADYPNLVDSLKTNQVSIKVLPLTSQKEKLIGFFIGWLPFIVMIGLWFWFIRGASEAGGAFKFAKSKAKLMQMKGKITFKDVAGIDEAKDNMKELVDFLKNSKKYTKIGAKIPKGCMLIGAPGTGKTLLARAIAGEAEVPFFFISGSDFVEMFVGVGASRVRSMFEEAKKKAPCIVFVDEIDAVGRRRGASIGGGNDEREQTLNQLLVEMDGFEGNEGVIVVAATNRPDVLDKALLRPGRFDRQIVIPLPDIKGREEILNLHAQKVNIAPDVDLGIIAKSTPGFSGADLANIVNEAALFAARNDKKMVTMREVEEATDKIIMGSANKSRVIKEEEKKLTAFHEAGHAIVTLNCKYADPIHKATIISRGAALGFVARLPESDKVSKTKVEILDDITIAMGGRVAEEMIFGRDMITTGASQDIKVATHYAKNMVVNWGLSDKVGPIYHADKLKTEEGFGFEAASNETLKLIDEEVKRIIDEGQVRARKILQTKKKDLEKIATALLEYETLTGNEIKDLLKGKKIQKEGIGAIGKKATLKTERFIPSFKDKE